MPSAYSRANDDNELLGGTEGGETSASASTRGAYSYHSLRQQLQQHHRKQQQLRKEAAEQHVAIELQQTAAQETEMSAASRHALISEDGPPAGFATGRHKLPISGAHSPSLGGGPPHASTNDLRVEDMAIDLEEMQLTAGAPTYVTTYSTHLWAPYLWKIVMRILVATPWLLVKGMSWVINRWQRVCWPLNAAVFGLSDWLDKHMPTVHAVLLWLWATVSLALHFVDVLLIFLVMNMLSKNGHNNYSIGMAWLYVLSHYLMAVTMYMECDRITGSAYGSGDFVMLLKRLLDVFFMDVQLGASVLHSNTMIEGTTQLLLQAYEESRVCLHALINTIPACIVLGILYDAMYLTHAFNDLMEHRTAVQQVYAAFALCLVNAAEKVTRFTLSDPWLHPPSKPGYPLLYMRSNAARLPHALISDWIFRCNVQLSENKEELRLKELFDLYTFNNKGDVKELCDGHKAYLLRKALRTFNGTTRYHRAELMARHLHNTKLKQPRCIRALDASRLRPAHDMAVLFGEMLADTHGFDTLNLSNNHLEDASLRCITEGLRANNVLHIKHFDLSCNEIGLEGCEALSAYLATSVCLLTLNLSMNPIREAAVKAFAPGLASNSSLQRLDLSSCHVGAEGAAALAAALKSNQVLRELILARTKVGTAGAESLARVLRSNRGLKVLNLSRTGVDDKGAASLATALTSNRSLCRLDLSYTSVGDEGAKALCDALPGNNMIQGVDVTGCTAMDKSWQQLLANIVGAGKAGAQD